MGIFRKKKIEIDVITPLRIKSTIGRPIDGDIVSVQKQTSDMKKPIINKVDKMFLQEISDRLYGPDSDGYIEALSELNKLFKPRAGKSFLEFYEPEISEGVRRKQKEINDNIKHES
jgi:hypothetical protein